MKEEALRNIVAEWLEERKLPELFERDMPPVDLAGLTSILVNFLFTKNQKGSRNLQVA